MVDGAPERERANEVQEFLASLIRSAEDAIIGTDLDGTIVSWNPAAERLYGYSAAEAIGNAVSFLVPPGRSGEEREVLETVAAGQPVHHHEIERIRKDGKEISVSIVFSPVSDELGKVVGASMIARDITKRRQNERLFRDLLESSPEAVVIVNEAGEITLVNARTERLFGYDRDELIGQPVELLVPKRFRDDHGRQRNSYSAHPHVRPMGTDLELFGRRKDGSEFPAEISLSPLETEQGRLISSAIVDVTEREALRQEADRLKDEFIGLVSHELRTPLTSIIGYLDLLSREDVGDLRDDQSRGYLEIIQRNSSRLLRLVGDLLLITQVQAGKFTLALKPCDLGALAAHSVEAARPGAEENDLDLALKVERLPKFSGDPDRLAQVFDNLIGNAVKYTPAGERIGVRLFASTDVIVVEVVNTGAYLSPEVLDQLFDRFFRASTETTRRTSGIGLGLAIVKAIVDAHGGRIEAKSEREVGTTFRVELPVQETGTVAQEAS